MKQMGRLSSGRGPFYTRGEGSRTGETEVKKVLEVSIFLDPTGRKARLRQEKADLLHQIAREVGGENKNSLKDVLNNCYP